MAEVLQAWPRAQLVVLADALVTVEGLLALVLHLPLLVVFGEVLLLLPPLWAVVVLVAVAMMSLGRPSRKHHSVVVRVVAVPLALVRQVPEDDKRRNSNCIPAKN